MGVVWSQYEALDSGVIITDSFFSANHTLPGLLQALHSFPSVLIYSDYLGLPPHYMMELCCLVGVALSCLVVAFRAMRCSFIFLLLWGLYLSVYQVSDIAGNQFESMQVSQVL